ncbi:MAG TPA: nuclease-related domain-containing protein, partial [Streptosporangiaceae bacterium]|nr:nuclease-related domain-containing protein [Streptosporangiaceae bacterium]
MRRVWQRYGQLRIYVLAGDLAGDGEIGWCDPRSGRFALSRPERADEFWAEVAAECQRLQQDGRLGCPVLPAALAARLPASLPSPEPPSALVPGRAEPGGGGPDDAGPSRDRLSVSEAAGEDPDPDPDLGPDPDPDPDLGPDLGRSPEGPASWPDDSHWVVREPEWDDLAANKPGSAALARSRELRRERPLLTTAADLLGFRSAARLFAIGAKGERIVGRRLDRWAARDGWHVLHAVPVGRHGADIDHVVIGPFGVVTINTKATGTSVWVGQYGMRRGGTTVDYLRKSRAERTRAGRL